MYSTLCVGSVPPMAVAFSCHRDKKLVQLCQRVEVTSSLLVMSVLLGMT